MPRGTRALHQIGSDSSSEIRSHSATLRIAVLPASCWCDRDYVLVHRQDILDGNTGSCGRNSCAPPDDSLPAASVPIGFKGTNWRIKTQHAGRPKFVRDASVPDDNLILHARRGRFIPRPRTYTPAERVRRDLIAVMHAERKHPIDIALILNVPVIVVRDDLVRLRREGRAA